MLSGAGVERSGTPAKSKHPSQLSDFEVLMKESADLVKAEAKLFKSDNAIEPMQLVS